VLSGCSAGGVGTLNNIDWLNSHFNEDLESPTVKVRGLPFSGMFVENVDDYDGTQTSNECADDCYKLWSLNGTYPMSGIDNCIQNSGDDYRDCMRTDLIVHHVETPVFMVEEMFDSAAIWGFRGDSSELSEGLEYALNYGTEARKAITDSGNEQNGFWMASCVGHCQQANNMARSMIDGQTLEETFVAWYEESSNSGKAPSLVEQCGRDGEMWPPCNQMVRDGLCGWPGAPETFV